MDRLTAANLVLVAVLVGAAACGGREHASTPGNDIVEVVFDVGSDVPASDVNRDGGFDSEVPIEDTLTGGQDPGASDASDVPDVIQLPATCSNMPPDAAASGACVVEAGSAWLLIQGHLMVQRDSTLDGFQRDGQVLIGPDGTIAAVGCDALAGIADAAGATKVLCRDVIVTPGLINGHDHLTYDGNAPKAHGTTRYDHRNEWRTGANGKKPIDVSPTDGQESWGELRNVLAGTTTMFGSGKADGLLRNLDKDLMTGIDATRKATPDVFPLGDLSGELLTSGCGYPSLPNATKIAASACWVPHVAEGVNAAARNEMLCMASPASGGVNAFLPHNGFIHGIGVIASDIAAMTGRNESLIWSPRSNIDLYGNTAAVTVYARLGHNIGLGTDWTASGSMNILRELRCADRFNATNLGAFFNDRDLLDMVTVNNANAFNLGDKLGVLAVGRLGDVSLWNASVHADERAVLDAAPQDVLLVLRGGVALYGDKDVVKALTADAIDCQDELDVCGVTKRACVLRETGKTLAALTTAGNYGLFFCGDPTAEPSCLPARPGEYDGLPKAGDMDGDGVPDAQDNCPTVFNPVRPLDAGGQADWDGDGIGDACDPCPMDAGATCRPIRADDLDGDGVPDATDVCPTIPDDGTDTDGDGKGDACDPCPSIANPGDESCPGTIYDVKTLKVPVNQTVRIKNVLVTGAGQTAGVPQGFNVQVVPADAAWNGSADNSGLFCYYPKGTPMPAAGDRVDIDGTVTTFHGQIELTKLTAVVIQSSGEAAPVPVEVSPAANVATGGTKAAALEGVLVRVFNVTVTDVNPPLGGSDKAPSNEFAVTGNLRIDDFIHPATPFPIVGDTFTTITGVLRLANDNSKIEPRDEIDLARPPTAPELASFGPAIGFALEGETGDTIPALTVKLLRTASDPVTIQVTSGNPSHVALPNGGAVVIPAGSLQATVPVIAKIADAVTVPLTARLGTASLTADVRVVAATEKPLLQAGSPEDLSLAPGADGTWTLTTDLPNYGTTPVGIAISVSPAGFATAPASVSVAPRSMVAVATVHAVALGDTTVTATLGISSLALATHVEALPGGGVFISEYVEGSGDNKAIEIFNGLSTPVGLNTCTLRLFANGASVATSSTTLADTGTLAPGATWVLCSTSALTPLKDKCNRLASTINHNGDDAYSLECGGVVVDTFGQIGTDPGTAWGVSGSLTYTVDHTLRRKCGIFHGQPDGSLKFDPSVEWDGYPKDTLDGLGSHDPVCP